MIDINTKFVSTPPSYTIGEKRETPHARMPHLPGFEHGQTGQGEEHGRAAPA
jgi:hypothetical protein